jgi:hypothetical protein
LTSIRIAFFYLEVVTLLFVFVLNVHISGNCLPSIGILTSQRQHIAVPPGNDHHMMDITTSQPHHANAIAHHDIIAGKH